MAKFIPEEKLSKKERSRLNKARRKLWETDPRTKIVNSKKIYKRNKTIIETE